MNSGLVKIGIKINQIYFMPLLIILLTQFCFVNREINYNLRCQQSLIIDRHYRFLNFLLLY